MTMNVDGLSNLSWDNVNPITLKQKTPILKWLEQIIIGHFLGKTALPYKMSLTVGEFQELMDRLGPCNISLESPIEDDDVRETLLQLRFDEWNEIKELLLQYRTVENTESEWLSKIIAAACLGSNHLWKDLGLNNRDKLSRLLSENFNELFIKNNKNMKWKRFFYKQLCEQEGAYVCRSPSCEECTAYQQCFGPEV